jgi:predicted ester cyclase
MTRAEIQHILQQHREGFIRRDPSALASLHVPDGTFESPAAGTVRGRSAIEEVYRYWFSAFPDLVLQWTSEVIEEDRAMFFWTLTGTHSGPFFGLEGTGARVSTAGAAELRFAEGGIQSVRHVFDFTGVLVAAGVLKARPA